MTQFISLRKSIITEINSGLSNILVPAEKPVQTRKQLARMSCTLARQLMSQDKSLSLSEAMTEAWEILRLSSNRLRFIEFKKIDKKTGKETLCRRVIMRDKWTNFHTPKGTGRPLKEGQFIYIDAGAYFSGKYSVRSTYNNRVTEIF